jgi:hypothetical protein
VPTTRPSRLSNGRILKELRLASRRGDRAALAVAVDQMRTLALSPRYWQKYLLLLRNPLARLVDLLVIKQGERIAHQKGWKLLGGGLRKPGGGLRPPSGASPQDGSRGRSPRSKNPKKPVRRRARAVSADQQLLFEL